MIRPRKGGDGLKYTVPMSHMARLGEINRTIQDPVDALRCGDGNRRPVHGRAGQVAPGPGHRAIVYDGGVLPPETIMQRVTITLDDDLMAELDRIIAARGYQNRSEAIRDLARSGLQQAAVEVAGSRHCVAALVYVYDHHARELPKRLTQEFHAHHDLSQATLHVHLDAESCLEVTVLKGRGDGGAGVRQPGDRRARRAPRPRGLHAGDRSDGTCALRGHAHSHAHRHDHGPRGRSAASATVAVTPHRRRDARLDPLPPLNHNRNSSLTQAAQSAPKRHSVPLLAQELFMRARVLIVDDDPVQRRLLENMVRKFGHEPLIAESGEAAVTLLTGRKPSASTASCSISSCPISTASACWRGCATPAAHVPVIVQTAHGGIDNVISAMRAGALDFVVKPVGAERLQVSLRNALDKGALEDELARIKRSRSGTLGFPRHHHPQPADARGAAHRREGRRRPPSRC